MNQKGTKHPTATSIAGVIETAEPCPHCLRLPKTLLHFLRARKREWYCSPACYEASLSNIYNGEVAPLEPASDGEDI